MSDRSRRPLARAGLALLVALAAGCASRDIDASSTFDPLTAFPARATYSWDTRANVLPDDPRIDNDETRTVLRDAARAEFAKRGYTETQGAADYKLHYQLGVNTWTGTGGATAVGTLSLALVDAQTGRRVWIGFARAQIFPGLTEQERKDRMRQIYAKMLEDFPPSQRPSS